MHIGHSRGLFKKQAAILTSQLVKLKKMWNVRSMSATCFWLFVEFRHSSTMILPLSHSHLRCYSYKKISDNLISQRSMFNHQPVTSNHITSLRLSSGSWEQVLEECKSMPIKEIKV
jgi:hypothetical protein